MINESIKTASSKSQRDATASSSISRACNRLNATISFCCVLIFDIYTCRLSCAITHSLRQSGIRSALHVLVCCCNVNRVVFQNVAFIAGKHFWKFQTQCTVLLVFRLNLFIFTVYLAVKCAAKHAFKQAI